MNEFREDMMKLIFRLQVLKDVNDPLDEAVRIAESHGLGQIDAVAMFNTLMQEQVTDDDEEPKAHVLH